MKLRQIEGGEYFMAKTTVKKKAPAKKKTVKKRAVQTIYGIEHEFVIITGGGFLVVVLASMLFFH